MIIAIHILILAVLVIGNVSAIVYGFTLGVFDSAPWPTYLTLILPTVVIIGSIIFIPTNIPSALHINNTIALTPRAFEERNKRSIFGIKQDLILFWDRIEVIEETRGLDVVNIVIKDISKKSEVSKYTDRETEQFSELRAALRTYVDNISTRPEPVVVAPSC
jgi:hypothetical protein